MVLVEAGTELKQIELRSGKVFLRGKERFKRGFSIEWAGGWGIPCLCPVIKVGKWELQLTEMSPGLVNAKAGDELERVCLRIGKCSLGGPSALEGALPSSWEGWWGTARPQRVSEVSPFVRDNLGIDQSWESTLKS